MRAATIVQVMQDLFYVLFYCMFYFTCDRSLTNLIVRARYYAGTCIQSQGNVQSEGRLLAAADRTRPDWQAS